jgi:hypothetical protein
MRRRIMRRCGLMSIFEVCTHQYPDTTFTGHALGHSGYAANKGPGGRCRRVFPGSQNVTASAASGFGVGPARQLGSLDLTGVHFWAWRFLARVAIPDRRLFRDGIHLSPT